MNYAVIVAGGKGSRFSSEIKKQFFKINNELSVLEVTISIFNNHDLIDSIVVVLPKENLNISSSFKQKFSKIITVVPGGKERFYSVYNGLTALKEYIDPESKILIHDGVRPFVSNTLIKNVLDELEHYDCVIPCIAIDDTVKEVEAGFVVKTVNRSKYMRAQTPQGFRKYILDMYKKVIGRNLSFTDDASIAEYFGKRIKIVEGDKKNIKITTTDDLKIFS